VSIRDKVEKQIRKAIEKATEPQIDSADTTDIDNAVEYVLDSEFISNWLMLAESAERIDEMQKEVDAIERPVMYPPTPCSIHIPRSFGAINEADAWYITKEKPPAEAQQIGFLCQVPVYLDNTISARDKDELVRVVEALVHAAGFHRRADK